MFEASLLRRDLTAAFMWYSGYIIGKSGFFFFDDLDSLRVGALK